MNVAILGASNKTHRYSYMATERLMKAGHKVFPIHKTVEEILGNKVYKNLSDIKEKIDTITVYVNKEISSELKPEILKLNPSRIIFNPGTENLELAEQARSLGIEVVYACTLVMLSFEQF